MAVSEGTDPTERNEPLHAIGENPEAGVRKGLWSAYRWPARAPAAAACLDSIAADAYHPAAMPWLLPHSARALGWRDACLALALFAAVVRSLLPPGFMLAPSEGEARIVLCTADGARTIEGKPIGEGDGGKALAAMAVPCAFAALAAMAPPPDPVRIAAAPIVAMRASFPAAGETRASLAAHRSQAPRAPPVLHA